MVMAYAHNPMPAQLDPPDSMQIMASRTSTPAYGDMEDGPELDCSVSFGSLLGRRGLVDVPPKAGGDPSVHSQNQRGMYSEGDRDHQSTTAHLKDSISSPSQVSLDNGGYFKAARGPWQPSHPEPNKCTSWAPIDDSSVQSAERRPRAGEGGTVAAPMTNRSDGSGREVEMTHLSGKVANRLASVDNIVPTLPHGHAHGTTPPGQLRQSPSTVPYVPESALGLKAITPTDAGRHAFRLSPHRTDRSPHGDRVPPGEAPAAFQVLPSDAVIGYGGDRGSLVYRVDCPAHNLSQVKPHAPPSSREKRRDGPEHMSTLRTHLAKADLPLAYKVYPVAIQKNELMFIDAALQVVKSAQAGSLLPRETSAMASARGSAETWPLDEAARPSPSRSTAATARATRDECCDHRADGFLGKMRSLLNDAAASSATVTAAACAAVPPLADAGFNAAFPFVENDEEDELVDLRSNLSHAEETRIVSADDEDCETIVLYQNDPPGSTWKGSATSGSGGNPSFAHSCDISEPVKLGGGERGVGSGPAARDGATLRRQCSLRAGWPSQAQLSGSSVASARHRDGFDESGSGDGARLWGLAHLVVPMAVVTKDNVERGILMPLFHCSLREFALKRRAGPSTTSLGAPSQQSSRGGWEDAGPTTSSLRSDLTFEPFPCHIVVAIVYQLLRALVVLNTELPHTAACGGEWSGAMGPQALQQYAGFSHNDLHLGNILLNFTSGAVALCDFELVYHLPRRGHDARATNGTGIASESLSRLPPYSRQSPHGLFTDTTDTWALAMAALEMLTGVSPLFNDDMLLDDFSNGPLLVSCDDVEEDGMVAGGIPIIDWEGNIREHVEGLLLARDSSGQLLQEVRRSGLLDFCGACLVNRRNARPCPAVAALLDMSQFSPFSEDPSVAERIVLEWIRTCL